MRLAILATVAAGALLPASASADFGYLTQWGTRGSGDSQFAGGISGIATDPGGNVYVEDNGNARVQKFAGDGSFLLKWTGNGQAFGSLDGIGVDQASNVYLGNHLSTPQVERWSPQGQFLAVFRQFPENIHDLTVDKQGNVIVSTGSGVPDQLFQKFDPSGNKVANWGTFGSADGQFSSSGATPPAADSQGNIYIADSALARIQKFSPTGQFLAKFGSSGTADGQFGFRGAVGVAVDSQDNVWVADPGNSRIEKFSPQGAFLAKFGSQGSGPGQFGSVIDVAADASGNVFAVDDNNSKIVKFGEKPAAPPPASVTQPKGSCTPAPPNVCVQGPEDLQKLGCLRIGNFQHRFGVALKKTRAGLIVNRVSRVKVVAFALDGGGAGSDKKRPYEIFVSGAVLKPGTHLLKATVRMQVPKYLVKRYPKRFKKTNFTRKLKFPFKTCP